MILITYKCCEKTFKNRQNKTGFFLKNKIKQNMLLQLCITDMSWVLYGKRRGSQWLLTNEADCSRRVDHIMRTHVCWNGFLSDRISLLMTVVDVSENRWCTKWWHLRGKEQNAERWWKMLCVIVATLCGHSAWPLPLTRDLFEIAKFLVAGHRTTLLLRRRLQCKGVVAFIERCMPCHVSRLLRMAPYNFVLIDMTWHDVHVGLSVY